MDETTETETVDVMARFQAAGADATEQAKLQRHHEGLSAEDRKLDAEGIAAMDDEELAAQIPLRLAAFAAGADETPETAEPAEEPDEGDTGDEGSATGDDTADEAKAAAEGGVWTPAENVVVNGQPFAAWDLEGGYKAVLIGTEVDGQHVVAPAETFEAEVAAVLDQETATPEA